MIPYPVVLDWMARHSGLRRLLRQSTLIDASIAREWLVNVGRRTAYQRTAHLLCELTSRMRWAGLASGPACDMPFTQVELADALGLTPVHLNRTLQWLRGSWLVELSGGSLTALDWNEFTRTAEFEPAYLHRPALVG